MIAVKRVYEPWSKDDGTRILVDRLWPRGLSRNGARIDHWMKDIAPSTELRRWYDHDLTLWSEFKVRYADELTTELARRAVAELRAFQQAGPVTLLYAARDRDFNNAEALRAILLG